MNNKDYEISALCMLTKQHSFFISNLSTTGNYVSGDILQMDHDNIMEEIIGEISFAQINFAVSDKIEHILNVDIRVNNVNGQFDDILNQTNKDFEKFKNVVKNYFLRNDGNTYFMRCSLYEDFQSKKINEKLSALFYDVENKFREIIDKILTIEVGCNWNDDIVDVYNLLKKKGEYCKEVEVFKNIDEKLFNLLTDQLFEIIGPPELILSPDVANSDFVKKELANALGVLIDKNVTNEKRVQFFKESQLFTSGNDSYLNLYFSNLYMDSGDRMFQNKWQEATKKRNHIAHNKPLDLHFYKSADTLFRELLSEFDRFMTEYQYRRNIEQVNISIPDLSFLVEQRDFDDGFTSDEISDLEDELRLVEEENLAQIAENEAGIRVRNRTEIIDLIGSVINEKIDSLFSTLYDNDANILVNNSFGEGGVLLEANHRYLKDKGIKISVQELHVDESKGSRSYVILKQVIPDEEIQFFEIEYLNGDYYYNEDQCNYMPKQEDSLNAGLFIKHIEIIIETIDEIIPNLLKMANNDFENYIRAKDGCEGILIEESCPYCDFYETVTTYDKYFELADIEWQPNVGLCLECGEICTVGHNAEGYTKLVPYGEDPCLIDLHLDN